jgi:iron complex outermembrane recepter protein
MTETPLQSQHVPSTDVGGWLTWTKTIFPHNQLLAGGDFRWIDGQSDDSYYNPSGTAVSDRKVSEGRQNFFGAFIEDVYRPSEKVEADLSVRSDVFQNLVGQIQDTPVGDKRGVVHFPDRTRTATSPKVGLRVAPWRWLSMRGSLYQAFRAPTLAELYRQSSVERLVLLPNPKLAPEFLEGGEIGLELAAPGPFSLDLSGYWNILHRPIGNVVTAVDQVTGADAQRTRVNFGRARIRGYEIRSAYDLNWIPWGGWAAYHPHLRFLLDYLRSEATLTYNPPDPTLEGRRLALVPWSTGVGQATYQDDLFGQANLQVAFQGMQWEDSDNHDRQRAYWLMNLSWSHPLPTFLRPRPFDDASLYIRIQNLLDHDYVIDRGGGIPKLGTPFMLQGGFLAPLWFR